ncbi:hypothetical protein J6590_062957 [Homalodisca vitripennis]|nr:hypothetical protein J6590_062957 [Homalodisca vitripennis]
MPLNNESNQISLMKKYTEITKEGNADAATLRVQIASFVTQTQNSSVITGSLGCNPAAFITNKIARNQHEKLCTFLQTLRYLLELRGAPEVLRAVAGHDTRTFHSLPASTGGCIVLACSSNDTCQIDTPKSFLMDLHRKRTQLPTSPIQYLMSLCGSSAKVLLGLRGNFNFLS